MKCSGKPEGDEWPLRCPDCKSWSFYFKTDRSGNLRRYRCGKCGSLWMGTIRGLPLTTAMGEPKNLVAKDMDWIRILTSQTQ